MVSKRNVPSGRASLDPWVPTQCGVGWLTIPPRDGRNYHHCQIRRGKKPAHCRRNVLYSLLYLSKHSSADPETFPHKYIQVAHTRAFQKSCLPSQQCPEHYFSPSKREASAGWRGSHTIFLLLIRLGPRSSNNMLSFKIFHQDPALSLYKLLFHYFICLTNTSPGKASVGTEEGVVRSRHIVPACGIQNLHTYPVNACAYDLWISNAKAFFLAW